jgi:hypothetical protein
MGTYLLMLISTRLVIGWVLKTQTKCNEEAESLKLKVPLLKAETGELKAA